MAPQSSIPFHRSLNHALPDNSRSSCHPSRPASIATSASSKLRNRNQSRQSIHSPHVSISESSYAMSHNADGNDDTLNEIIMAVDMTLRGTVGCCYYMARDEKLYFMEDIEYGDVDVIDALRLYIDPTVILVSTKVDDTIINRFDPGFKDRTSTSSDRDQFRLPFVLEVRPPSEFRYEIARSKLANLNIGQGTGKQVRFSVPGELTVVDHCTGEEPAGQQGQLLRLAGWIDLESRNTIGCAGALLSYIQRRRAAAYLPGDHTAHTMFCISALEMFSLRETMFVNADTLRSLQILDAESHPHSHNCGPTKATSGAKEGLSVYGLFHHLARTPQGRFLLRQQFIRPSLNIDVIDERLNTVEIMLRAENDPSLEALVGNLKNIGNMRVVMINLRKGSSGLSKGAGGLPRSIWSTIREFAYHTLKIKDAFQDVLGGEHLPIRNKVFEQFEGYHLAQVGRKISETVDFEKSIEESRTVILQGVDEELDQMKRTLDGLENFLNEVARKLSEKMPPDLRSSLNVIYFPQIGFLVTVPIDAATGSAIYEGNIENPWERMFSTEVQVYFKTNEMREMDDHFGDVYGIISDREIEIGHELAQYVLQYEQLLTVCSDICGDLDSLLALAQGAKVYNLCRPKMTMNNTININGGRHILQEFSVPSFVPNDTFLAGGPGHDAPKENPDDYEYDADRVVPVPSAQSTFTNETGPSMLILTGPNFSGKSVYLKQVALIVLMAHVGSFVPAENAEIGLTDKILSRVTTRETVSRNQSAFMLDLQQITLALSLMTRRSLLIVDEFGKGTDSSDGAGLAAAVMEYLLEMGPERPKVISSTHFHEIFEMNILKSRPYLAFGHMEVRIDTAAANVSEQVTYLYNFCSGRSTSSFGTCCAALNGIPSEIVQRAEDLIVLTMRGGDLVGLCCQIPEDESAELEEAEQIARRFLQADIHKDPEAALGKILSIRQL